jgi:acyl-coenzyme A synthetase/AMP-(fatty) acid ligase
MYRSGDLGSWRPDGTIEYIGRNDSQVKIRGFRIELGDIECHLATIAGVREAVVLAREESGEARLVAYLTSEEGAQLSAAALKAELLKRLPVYMMPSDFVFLPQMPISGSGKIDRRALLAPGLSHSSSTVSRAASSRSP